MSDECAAALAKGVELGAAKAIAAAAALIRSFDVEMRLTVLPNGKGEAVVRDLKAELAKLVEGLA